MDVTSSIGDGVPEEDEEMDNDDSSDDEVAVGDGSVRDSADVEGSAQDGPPMHGESESSQRRKISVRKRRLSMSLTLAPGRRAAKNYNVSRDDSGVGVSPGSPQDVDASSVVSQQGSLPDADVIMAT